MRGTDRHRSAALVALTWVLPAAMALATDHPIPGRKLLVRDPIGSVFYRKLLVTGRDGPGSLATIVADPTVTGATLGVSAHGGTGSDQTFDLPAAGWRRSGSTGFRYRNAQTGGAVKTLTIRRSTSGRFRVSLKARGADGPLAVVPPNPGTDGVVVLALGGDRYCLGFGGAAGGTERRDDGGTWQVRGPTASACPPAPSTTTSTTSTTTTAVPTTSTTSTTIPSTTTTTSTTSTTTTTTTVATTTTTTTTTATTTTTTTATTTTSSTTTTLPVVVKEVNLLYVHGVKNCSDARTNAQNTFTDLEASVNAGLASRIAAYQLAHPGTVVVVNSARANLYTATPSGFHPSDSPDPLNMDDWEVGDPGCTTTQQGDPCTTAYEWRYRLAREIDRLFPAPAKNVVLIGHSAGARVAMDVAANVGTGGVASHDWGVQGRIAGVISIQGVIDALGSSKYNVVGFTSFESACKLGDAIVGFGDSCAPGNGWCEYVGRVDGFSGADWVADNKRALMLSSWGSCSPSAWSGQSDGSLPYDAQGSPQAVGLDMTPAPGQTWREAHGQRYGAFCHSTITNTGDANHVAARTAATTRILDWLFTAAPRVAASGTDSTSGSIPYLGFSSTFTMGAACPSGEVDDTVTSGTKGPGIDVVGVCRHPGFFDGDDHAVALGEFTVTNGSTCNGTYKWQQAHDSSNNHAGVFWWKTRSLRQAGPDLIAGLPPS